MIPIFGSINGQYLRNITLQAAPHTDIVYAAVAYATTKSVLFDWCVDNNIPLKFWGRYDDTIPISIRILEGFLKKRSANYQCRLVTKFHPKVIWWKGFGAYIGSANLTDAAWNYNIEAGMFFRDDEMEDTGLSNDLNEFFRVINENAFDLTDEIILEMKKRSEKLNQFKMDNQEDATKFMKLAGVTQWSGLVTTSKKKSDERKRLAFIGEWNETLQHMRNIAHKVGLSENRPVWIRPDVPESLIADQFLHAYYYNFTFDGKRANFEVYFERNQNNPDHAIQTSIDWWKKTKEPPSGEDETLDVDAPFVFKLLRKDTLKTISLEDWQEICQRVHSIKDYARRVGNTKVGLPHRSKYTILEKTDALAKFHFTLRNEYGENIKEVLWYVLYGGDDINLPNRIWEAISDPRRRIERFGLSAIGELTGWAIPDKFPPRNRRTSKALRALGFNVSVH